MEIKEQDPEDNTGLIEGFMMWHIGNAPGRDQEWWPAISNTMFHDSRWRWHMERARKEDECNVEKASNTLPFDEWKKELLATMPDYGQKE